MLQGSKSSVGLKPNLGGQIFHSLRLISNIFSVFKKNSSNDKSFKCISSEYAHGSCEWDKWILVSETAFHFAYSN